MYLACDRADTGTRGSANQRALEPATEQGAKDRTACSTDQCALAGTDVALLIVIVIAVVVACIVVVLAVVLMTICTPPLVGAVILAAAGAVANAVIKVSVLLGTGDSAT